ncbi:ABC transporter permease [Indioceanicola profundi]|uniref:ABC transporter permease n=1 Tax=Indioceanicola profundi TaxID=2220096 RepID=UPI000E6AE2D6|nr:ABC transporter permease subunit [Indioceanicola profundi]
MTDANANRRRVRTALSIAAIVAVWALAAAIAQSPTLPGPAAVLAVVVREAESGALLHHLGITLWRVAAAFVLAFFIGAAAGLLMGRSRFADEVLGPWLTLALNIPALVVIVLAYVWLGLTEAAAITAVAINKIPNVVVVVREGAKAMDEKLIEMGRSYRLSRLDMLRHVLLPQLQPYLLAASRSGLALIWKIVLVVELLGRSNGVGFQIHLAFQLFDVALLLAYALSFVVVAQAIELFLLSPLDRHVARWRTTAAEA